MRKLVPIDAVGFAAVAIVVLGGIIFKQVGSDGAVLAAEGDHIGYVGIDMDSSGNTLPDASGPGTIDATPER